MRGWVAACVLVVGCDSGGVRVKDEVPQDSDAPSSVDSDVDSDDAEVVVLTETFLAPGGEPLDVLFVVDDSCSMIEEQGFLAEQLPTLLASAETYDLDVHIGVVSTDMSATGRNGALVEKEGLSFVTRDTPNASEVLGAMVQLGTGGSPTEKGLLAAHDAVAQPRPELQTANAGFIRTDASLHAVVLSDEEDQSAPAMFRAGFVDWARSLKGDPSLTVTLSAIVGPTPAGCRAAWADAVAGTIYLAAAADLGGATLSICEEDWEPFFASLLLQTTLSKPVAFTLANDPDPASVQVSIASGGKAWTGVWAGSGDVCATGDCFLFELSGRELRVVDWPPPPAALVTVTYTPR